MGLVDAGAVLLGTSTRPDPAVVNQAWGWNGREHTSNPWRTDRSSGGSSAGAAAAVAAGVIPVATGGDSAGSLRIPAAFCGVTGLKGTYGRVALRRGRSLAQLTVAGVIGADLADTVLATSIASGPDPRDPAALPRWPVPAIAGKQLTVGFSADLGYARPDPAVAGLVAGRLQALAAAGMIRLREVTVRLADPAAGWLPLAALDRGQLTDPSQLTRAHEVRRHNDHELAALFGDIDVLVTPTTPQTAFPLEDYEANLPARHLLLGLQPVRPPGGHRPGPARRPPGRVAGRRRAAPRRPSRGAGRAGRGQPAGSAGPLASCPRLTSSAGAGAAAGERTRSSHRAGCAVNTYLMAVPFSTPRTQTADRPNSGR